MDELFIYGRLGFKHIIDLNGSDHILFILALVLRYVWEDWKKVLILVTSFTIGHSVTLALSTLNWIYFSTNWIELLIPFTILFTAASNFWVHSFTFQSKHPFIYFAALFFGLIHGLGFSNYLKSLLGQEETIIGPLFSFNLGLELGQLLIVSLILLFSFIFVFQFKVNRRLYIRLGSIITSLFAFNMVFDRVTLFFK